MCKEYSLILSVFLLFMFLSSYCDCCRDCRSIVTTTIRKSKNYKNYNEDSTNSIVGNVNEYWNLFMHLEIAYHILISSLTMKIMDLNPLNSLTKKGVKGDSSFTVVLNHVPSVILPHLRADFSASVFIRP